MERNGVEGGREMGLLEAAVGNVVGTDVVENSDTATSVELIGFGAHLGGEIVVQDFVDGVELKF